MYLSPVKSVHFKYFKYFKIKEGADIDINTSVDVMTHGPSEL
jgi:hypothetical protein